MQKSLGIVQVEAASFSTRRTPPQTARTTIRPSRHPPSDHSALDRTKKTKKLASRKENQPRAQLASHPSQTHNHRIQFQQPDPSLPPTQARPPEKRLRERLNSAPANHNSPQPSPLPRPFLPPPPPLPFLPRLHFLSTHPTHLLLPQEPNQPDVPQPKHVVTRKPHPTRPDPTRKPDEHFSRPFHNAKTKRAEPEEPLSRAVLV